MRNSVEPSRFKAGSIIASLLIYAVAMHTATASQPIDDVAQGQAVYFKCMGCHSPERNRTGPKHCGLIGRKAGTAAGYSYSQAMQQSDIVWSEETLNQFLSNPLKFVPGTTMAIAGIRNATERHDLISYLASLDSEAKCQ